MDRVVSVAKVVEEVRRGSSTCIRNQGIADFDWHPGYGAFSVSDQNAERVIRYLDNQESRHRELTFAEEYQGFLRKCGGREQEINVRYVFSTKNRIPFLADDALRERLHDRLAEICEIAGSPSLARTTSSISARPRQCSSSRSGRHGRGGASLSRAGGREISQHPTRGRGLGDK